MKQLQVLALLGATVLGACAAPTPVTQAQFVGIDDVSVTISDDASYGLVQATQDPEYVQRFERAFIADIQSAIVTGGSGNTAEISVERMTVQSGPGRVVAAAESQVSGDVTVSRADGSIVATFDNVTFTNAASRNQSTLNGIPVGALLSMASNAAGSSADEQISALSVGFAAEVAAKLGR